MTLQEFRIVEDFESVQGEGHFTGTYALFVRLAGCNGPSHGLDCANWCDTDFETPRWTASVENFEQWFGEQFTVPLLIFTGGEPLLYKDTLVKWLNTTKCLDTTKTQVCVETNGTIDRPILEDVWWTVSPKGPEYRLGVGPINEIKLVVTSSMTSSAVVKTLDLLDDLSHQRHCKFYLQPLDNDLELAREIVEKLISRRTEWCLSLQTHKLIAML